MSSEKPRFWANRWHTAILNHIAEHPQRPLRRRALARELDVPSEHYSAFRQLIQHMLQDQTLAHGRGGNLVLPQREDMVSGVLHLDERGFGFVERPGESGLYVPPRATGGAMHGDLIEARLLPARAGSRPACRVLRVLRAARPRWVGLLQRHGPHWTVVALGRGPLVVIDVAPPGGDDREDGALSAAAARDGDLVVVEPLQPAAGSRRPRGVIVECLGDGSHPRVRVQAAIRQFEIPDQFSEEAIAEARRSAARLDALERDDADHAESPDFADRLDLRDLLVVTVDPADARDFDDAISITPLPDGAAELGVHIADVSYFVPTGGPLDAAALARGTSVYFPGFVVPMLPESISNGVCSLREGQPRLTCSVFIRYDRQGRVTQTRFARSIIRSRKRLTYEQVDQALDGGEGGATPRAKPATRRLAATRGGALAHDGRESSRRETILDVSGTADGGCATLSAGGGYATLSHEGGCAARSHRTGEPQPVEPDVADLLRRAAALARRIQARRRRAGMISLALPELRITLGPDGRVADAGPAGSGFSHTMIEMFMVEANETVSRRLSERHVPHLRRVHAAPDAEGAAQLLQRLAAVDCSVPKKLDRAALQRLIDAVRGKPLEAPVNLLLLRSMERASYSPEPIGHYALASEHYCHFTSPIRRYPDLTVHRLFDLCVERAARAGRAAAPDRPGLPLADLGGQLSALERRAQDAERTATTSCALSLLSARLGEAFDGVIIGMNSRGVFVQLARYLVDGLVPLSELPDDHWRFSKADATLTGRDSARVITIGQPVRVRIAAVDDLRQMLLLSPVGGRLGAASHERPARRRKGTRGRGSRRA